MLGAISAFAFRHRETKKNLSEFTIKAHECWDTEKET
jgi:hypothetical protein